MAVVRDALGNVIKEGDLISIEVSSPRLVAKVVEIRNGGVSLRIDKQQHVTPGVIETHAALFTQFDPSNPVVGNMLKLHQPAKSKDEEKSSADERKLIELPN